MSNQVFLKMNAVGYRTVFSDTGDTLVFKDGVCKLTDEQLDNQRLGEWLNYNGKGFGISLMSQEEIAERAKIAQQEAEAAQKRAAYQGQIDAIINGVDPQLIPAETPKVQTTATIATSATTGQSVQEKIAQAKAAAAGKSN